LAEKCVEGYSNANGEVAWARAFAEHPEWKAVLLKGDPRKCLHRLHSWAYVYKQNKNVVKLEQNAKDGADLVEFLTYSGARVDEGNSSLWRDVNFEPYVMPAFKAPAGTITINGTKSLTSQRTIPMLPPLRDFLKRLHAEKNPKPEDRIIPIKSARKCLQTACKKLGFPIFTHHDFRHLFATTCIEAGVPIPTIAAWLGHNDGGVLAMKTYGHLRQAHSFDMAALVTTFGPKAAAQ
jgi:integrase